MTTRDDIFEDYQGPDNPGYIGNEEPTVRVEVPHLPPRDPQPEMGYCFQAYLPESTDIKDIPNHSWDIEVLPRTESYQYRGDVSFYSNTYHVWWGGEEVGFIAQTAR